MNPNYLALREEVSVYDVAAQRPLRMLLQINYFLNIA
jgi:hypothetical protein